MFLNNTIPKYISYVTQKKEDNIEKESSIGNFDRQYLCFIIQFNDLRIQSIYHKPVQFNNNDNNNKSSIRIFPKFNRYLNQ